MMLCLLILLIYLLLATRHFPASCFYYYTIESGSLWNIISLHTYQLHTCKFIPSIRRVSIYIYICILVLFFLTVLMREIVKVRYDNPYVLTWPGNADNKDEVRQYSEIIGKNIIVVTL